MKPPTEQRVGAVVDALVTLCSAIESVSVNDGPLRQQVVQNDLLIIGDTRRNGEGYTVRLEPQPGLNADAYFEYLTVYCSAMSWSGSKTVKPRRDRVIDLMTQTRAAIAADVTLGGACDIAQIGTAQSWLPENNPDGALVGLLFQIDVRTAV